MPSWPTQSDYKDALQNPDTAFRDPELKVSKAETSPMGVPRARSGAFASVYKMTGAKGATALKLFNFPNEDRASRYLAVSDYLKVLGAKRPSAMVGFKYHPEGIRIGRGWYPTLTMDWVKGKSLGEWVREAMEKKTPDVTTVRGMADAWVKLVGDIQTAQIAHGDLQHDNVMVVGNQPVLVDYDGMCVPALAPSDPGKRLDQLEFGKPAYQHPARPAEKLGPHLDHFAAWVILIALRAMAFDPSLYVRYVTKTENENLLFTPPDMQTPDKSVLWPELIRSKDPEVAQWSKMIRDSLDRPFQFIPGFNLDPFDQLRKMVLAVPRDWAAISAETQRLTKAGKQLPADLVAATDPVGRLRELCNAARKDYPAIATEVDGLTRGGKAIPNELKNEAADAIKRVNCRDAVKRALDAKDPRAVRDKYQKPLLEGWADRRLMSDAEAAIAQVETLEKLKLAVAAPGDGRALIKLWNADGFKVVGLPEADGYQTEAKRWEERIAAAEAFVKTYSTPNQSEQVVAAAWKKVTDAGIHPTLLKPEHRVRGEQAAKWAPMLAKLAKIPTVVNYANDSALLSAWAGGSLLTGCKEAEQYGARIAPANDRVSKVNTLKRAIDAADAGTGTEAAVVSAAKHLPANYPHPYAERVTLGAKSVTALSALKAAVDENPPSDRKIAAAVDELRKTNVELLGRLDKVDPELAGEAVAAGRRRKALNEFAEIDKNTSDPDEQDRRWQAMWAKHKPLLHGRRDTEELRDRLTRSVKRTKAWTDLAAALDARDMFKLKALHVEHAELLRNYPPLLERTSELQELLGKADRVIEIEGKLKTAGSMLTDDDLRFLRDNHNAFGPKAKEVIVNRITARLKSDAMLRPGNPPMKVIPAGRLSTVAATWVWAGAGLVSHCLVAVDRNKHLNSPTEADQYGLLPCRVEDHAREGGGKRVVPPPGANRVFVTVWAVVELGWTTVHGPPLHLGPAQVGSGQW